MTPSFIVQSLFVLALPGVLAMLPSEGSLRTVALHPVSMSAVVNAVIETDGRILSARADGLVVTGRRDRITRALLPLGVLALPVTAPGCSARKDG